MGIRSVFLFLAACVAVACGGGVTTHEGAPTKDASTVADAANTPDTTDAADTADSGADSRDGASVAADGPSSDGPAPEGSSCRGPGVSNVEPSDAGGLSMGMCGSALTDHSCAGQLPQVSFTCPVVHGPGDSGIVHPGDAITITLFMTNGVVEYPCLGLAADHGVTGELPNAGSYQLGAQTNVPVALTAQIPATLAPGTVVHFSAYLDSLNCIEILGRLDFDVTVE